MNETIPEFCGGGGLSILDSCVIAEEISWGCVGMNTSRAANSLAVTPILVAATDEQKKEFLSRATLRDNDVRCLRSDRVGSGLRCRLCRHHGKARGRRVHTERNQMFHHQRRCGRPLHHFRLDRQRKEAPGFELFRRHQGYAGRFGRKRRRQDGAPRL